MLNQDIYLSDIYLKISEEKLLGRMKFEKRIFRKITKILGKIHFLQFHILEVCKLLLGLVSYKKKNLLRSFVGQKRFIFTPPAFVEKRNKLLLERSKT